MLEPKSVSCCLRLCLGWVGAVGGAVGVPVTVVLALRTQFTMFLFMLLTLDAHLKLHLAERYSSVVTRQRALCVVLLCWVGSILCSFAQFIGSDILNTWSSGRTGPDTAGHDVSGNWTTSSPHLFLSAAPKYQHDRKVIGQYLPYGGFLSKFYVEDMRNFTYAEIHSSHSGVCATDNVISPQFQVYVHGVTMFILPLLLLLALYLNLLCMKPRKTPFGEAHPLKHASHPFRSLTLSLTLLVLLCLPLFVIHTLFLFTPNIHLPVWAHGLASFLFQLYSVVPSVLFTPPRRQMAQERASFPFVVPYLQSAVIHSRGKSVRMALREAVQAAPWSSAKHSLKAKVCPEV
ncbi:unnamed protein product [Menidia menidia]|uniref:(Atlantic silverside) hypothetical protein n=1 Tax=Menidia menidia TaxID=238744 RepID=A0A8S4BK34_9TELE|nr:unnamed protein product [Menidia menidia]